MFIKKFVITQSNIVQENLFLFENGLRNVLQNMLYKAQFSFFRITVSFVPAQHISWYIK